MIQNLLKIARAVRLRVIYLLPVLACLSGDVMAEEFHSAWPESVERVWVGPEYWANRLQDWRSSRGRLECTESSPGKPMRTVHLLTRSLGRGRGELAMTGRTGRAGRKIVGGRL